MERPASETVTLDDILVTEELSQRSPRRPNWQAEAQAMQSLVRQMTRDSETLLQTLVETAVELCQAGTAGVSLLETTPDGEEVFCWSELAGRLAQPVDGAIPRDFSPWGVCLARGTSQLFFHPDRYFTYLQSANPPIVEALVLPLIADGHALGTIWILSHDEQRHFDWEDVRVMTSLADFAVAHFLNQRQAQQLLAANAKLEIIDSTERTHAEEALRESQERLRAIYNGTYEYIGLLSPDGMLLEANHASLEFGGTAREDVVGRPFWETIWFVHTPGAPEKLREAIARAAAGEFIRYEAPLRRPSGEVVVFDFSLYPIRDEQGKVILIVPEGRDVTDRKRVEEALRESEEQYRTLFNRMDEGFCILQLIFDEGQKPTDYRYIEINPVFEKQTGMKNALGKTIRELVPEIEEFWLDIYGKVALSGEPTQFEDHAVSMGRWFDINAFRIGEPHERKVAVLFKDITVRKQAEAAMRAFFSNVSHEFRTPLTLLLSSIQETLSDSRSDPGGNRAHPLTPTQQSQLQLAHRNAMRLLELVNTLLDFSRIEAGRIRAVFEPTDLATLTLELASSFKAAIEQTGLRLVIDCPPLRSPVYVDRSIWEKIVLNLLSNAFKFTFAGEIAVRLTLAGNSLPDGKAEQVELTVQDTGIGVAAAELPRLFERFYQVKGVKGRSFEGSGFSLSLVQELVLLHGGTIQVSSVEGEGSCFKVSIPTGFAHLASEQIGSSQTLPSTATSVTAYVEEALGWLPEEAGEQGSHHPRAEVPSVEGSGVSRGAKERTHIEVSPLLSSSAPLFRPARILLVDDNADMRTYLKRILSERWQVETAANGAIALTQIQQQAPDLVLTDVMMPQLNGLQLLRALRSNPQTQSISVILLSARAGEEAILEGLEAGADDYLIKPFSSRELVARVAAHLQLARLRQELSANHFKNEFLLTVTHELQAPLAAILGWARLLQTKAFDPATTARALATIERNATVEAKLVKDLLDVCSLLSGKLRLKTQLVDLVSLVQSVITTVRKGAEAKSIQLVETISDIAESTILADGDRLRQVITNLLSNAIKFTPEGGQVNLQLDRCGSYAQITVSDNGIGIAPDFLPNVFDRFSQAEVPSSHSPGGVGIGLTIARLLIELHNGSIAVASEGEGRGATFTVRLPMMNATELNSKAPAQEA